MKQIYIFLIGVICCYNSFGQVGIGTMNPQQTLHVAGGTNSTIRIEGLDVVNNPLNRGAGNLTPVYVTSEGNLTLTAPGYGVNNLPVNFLIDSSNFVPDNIEGLPAPFTNRGRVITSDASTESVTELIHTVSITVPVASMIEIKHAMSVMYSGSDLTLPPYTASFISDEKTRSYETFFCFDLNSDGLSAAEYNHQYGRKGQYYGTAKGGTRGFTYMNSQGYAVLPPGTHTIYFYGVVTDPPNTFTSFGFGGANEYLRIRVY
ncbi:hypothetical protein [Flavobacterium okayamense]|uniref:DUF4397 domain-containing protein n=1 Tax=Flavobacterium okayamense TaxID=2830782 RepID=A0ABN6HWW8_9FLAO|nr:hypothetical protein [Flavobacterium okayamense]BCY27910.1 hypothetical protein KK2020170_07780 [Flavobacterium okayamense]